MIKTMFVILMMCGICQAEEPDFEFYVSTGMYAFHDYRPAHSIKFSGGDFGDEKEVGSLSWKNGVLKFEGNVDESAKILFENMIKHYIDLDCIKKSQED